MKSHIFCLPAVVVFISGCISNQSFVDDAKRTTYPANQSLSVIHSLPENIQCKKLLKKAANLVAKRGRIPIKLNPAAGLTEAINNNWFYMLAGVDRYPNSSKIRDFECPKKLEDIKVHYSLIQGPGYTPWYSYSYSYNGPSKDIDFIRGLNPRARISLPFNDKPPELTVNIDKLYIFSLRPKLEFSNHELKFVFSSLIFQTDTKFSFDLINTGNHFLKIERFVLAVGDNVMKVNFGELNPVVLAPDFYYTQENMVIEHFEEKMGKFNEWYLYNTNSPIPVTASILYEINGKEKTLHIKKNVKAKDLNINI